MALVLQRPWAAAVPVAALTVVLLLSTTAMCSGAAQHVSAPPSSAATAAAPAPAAGMDATCLNSLLNMSDCLPYVQAGSTTRKPDAPCCPELAGMVDSNPVCLCELLSGAADSYGIAVDYARALALPGVCRVATPPVSTCEALGYHVRGLAPSSAPGMSPGVSPSGDSPQFPGSSPFASPPAPGKSHAARRFPNLVALAALPLAVAVATWIF